MKLLWTPNSQIFQQERVTNIQPIRAAISPQWGQDVVLFGSSPKTIANFWMTVYGNIKKLYERFIVKPFRWIGQQLGFITRQEYPSKISPIKSKLPKPEPNTVGPIPAQHPNANGEKKIKVLSAKIASMNRSDQLTPLILEAARRAIPTSIMDTLIKKKVDVNWSDGYGTSALHLASMGSPEKVSLLLNHGVLINAKIEDGLTPLHYAIQNGRADIMKILLKRGADVQAKCEKGNTCLHYAAESTKVSLEIIKCLLDSGLKIEARNHNGYTPILLAQSKDAFDNLIAHGADITAVSNNGQSLLHTLVQFGSPEDIANLLKQGAKLQATTGQNETALSSALKMGKTDNAQLLLRQGLQYTDADIVQAAKQFNPDLFQLLVQNEKQYQEVLRTVHLNPEASIVWKQGVERLSTAKPEERQKIVDFMKRYLAPNPNAFRINTLSPQGAIGWFSNALHRAIEVQDDELVSLLLDCKADINLQRRAMGSNSLLFQTPIHQAMSLNNTKLCKLLIDKGANCNIPDIPTNGTESLLFKAIEQDNQDILDILLKRKKVIDINEGSLKNGDAGSIKTSPLYAAVSQGNLRAVQALIQAGADLRIGYQSANANIPSIEHAKALLERAESGQNPENRLVFRCIIDTLQTALEMA